MRRLRASLSHCLCIFYVAHVMVARGKTSSHESVALLCDVLNVITARNMVFAATCHDTCRHIINT